MAIAFVAASATDGNVDAGGTPLTFSFDVGAGSNRCIVIKVSWLGSSHTLGDTAVTYNSVALTPLGATITANGISSRLYILAGPSAGSNTVSVDFSVGPTSNCITCCFAYTGVDQVTPSDNYTTAQGTDATAELTITSASGDMPVVAVGYRGNTPVSSAPTSYTERVDRVHAVEPTIAATGGDGTGAASVATVSTYTTSATNGWNALGLNLNASGGATLTGTLGDGATEAEIVAGGQVLTITLGGDTWIPA